MSESVRPYIKKTWIDGEIITKSKMDNISGALSEIDFEITHARTKGESDDGTLGKRIDDLIVISNTPPSSSNNTIWIKGSGSNVQVPTYDDFNILKDEIIDIKNNLGAGFSEKPFSEFTLNPNNGYIKESVGTFNENNSYKCYFFTADKNGTMYVTSTGAMVLAICTNISYDERGNIQGNIKSRRVTNNHDIPTIENPISFEIGDTIIFSFVKSASASVYINTLYVNAEKIEEMSNDINNLNNSVKDIIVAQGTTEIDDPENENYPNKLTPTSYPINIDAGRKYRLIVTGTSDASSVNYWINENVLGIRSEALINFDITFGAGEKYVDFIGVENAHYIRKGQHSKGIFSFVLIDITDTIMEKNTYMKQTIKTIQDTIENNKENFQEIMFKTPIVKFAFNDYTIKYDTNLLYEDNDDTIGNTDRISINNENHPNRFQLEVSNSNYIRFQHETFMEQLYKNFDELVYHHQDYMDRIPIIVEDKNQIELQIGQETIFESIRTTHTTTREYNFELEPPIYYEPDTTNIYKFDIRLYRLFQIGNTLANVEDEYETDYKPITDGLNKNRYTARPKLLLIGGTHAMEMESQYTLFQFVKNLCECTVNDADLFKLRNSFDIYVLPILDGYSQKYSHNAPEDNPFLGRTNYNGVNLNRNFYYNGWHKNERIDEENNTYKDNYTGEKAGSEFETQVVMDVIKVLQPDGVIDVHGHSNTSHVMYTILNNGKNGRARALYSSAADITIAFKRAYPEYYGTSPTLVDCGPAPKSTAINYGTVSAYATTIGIPLAACIEVPGLIAWNNGEYGGSWHHRCDCVVYGLDEYLLRNQVLHYCQWILEHVEKEKV